jgi:hypothetical protein
MMKEFSIFISDFSIFQALHVFENLDNGEILCSSCPNAKTFITGGTSTVSTINKKKILCHYIVQPTYGKNNLNSDCEFHEYQQHDKSCQCRNTDYCADDPLRDFYSITRGINPVIVIKKSRYQI